MVNVSENRFGGSWTAGKLDILEGYLRAYTTALKKQNFHLTYVDAFAGSGYVTPGDSKAQLYVAPLIDGLDEADRDLIRGSTRRAIEVKDRPFDRLVFIETDADRAAELCELRGEFPGRNIIVEQTDSNDFLRSWCENQNSNFGVPWRGHRAVVFLDPFATQVDWHTIATIAATQSVDLWILFPISALTRMLPRDRQPYESSASTLDRVFGGDEWRSMYQTVEAAQRSLFSPETLEPAQVVRDDQRRIVHIYLEKLADNFGAVVGEPKWLLNSKKSPLFAFMFAAANRGRGGQIALNIAKHLLERW